MYVCIPEKCLVLSSPIHTHSHRHRLLYTLSRHSRYDMIYADTIYYIDTYVCVCILEHFCLELEQHNVMFKDFIQRHPHTHTHSHIHTHYIERANCVCKRLHSWQICWHICTIYFIIITCILQYDYVKKFCFFFLSK